LLAIELRACWQRLPAVSVDAAKEQNAWQTSSAAASTFAGLAPATQHRSTRRILFMKQDPRLLLVRSSTENFACQPPTGVGRCLNPQPLISRTQAMNARPPMQHNFWSPGSYARHCRNLDSEHDLPRRASRLKAWSVHRGLVSVT
jgi:hypothetical protein